MAKSWARRFTKTTMVILTILVAIAFLHVCLVPYLNPKHFWWVGFAGLAAPYLVLLLAFATLFWLVMRPIIALLPILVLGVGYKQVRVFIALHQSPPPITEKLPHSLRLVTWNIQSFNGLTQNRAIKKLIRTDVAESILKLQPDIVCLQEFNHVYSSAKETDNISLFAAEYPFHFFSKDYSRNNGKYVSGCIIFSKFPIVSTGKIPYPKAESLIYADVIVHKNDTIRVFTTHLQSFKFKKNDYENIEKIKEQEQTLAASLNIFNKMKPAFTRRGIQADLVHTALQQAPHPAVICGDFNDVPNSYTYFKIRGRFKDAFIEKGSGIGRTFVSLAPTLRIDYILTHPQFTVQQFDMVDEGLSDHVLLVADMQLRTSQQPKK